ncbi:MAG: hypothetical protein R3C31_04575 [Hyphomonadaceae bacterium]
MFKLLRTLGIVLLTVLATLFCVQNLTTIEVAFLTWSIAAPRALIFFMLLATGFILGFVTHALRPSGKSHPPTGPSPPPAIEDQ